MPSAADDEAGHGKIQRGTCRFAQCIMRFSGAQAGFSGQSGAGKGAGEGVYAAHFSRLRRCRISSRPMRWMCSWQAPRVPRCHAMITTS
ncbi:MAG: hypothetical protein F4X92_04935 [Gammaproteobacteria bacterium]|nr:hypothetical protein [Gammaproteobacteria bacterium]